MDYDREFLTGTVGVLILGLLTEREMYGYEIVSSIRESTNEMLDFGDGEPADRLDRLGNVGLH